MSAPLYRETTDYVWALTRQIDRVAEAASSIDAAEVKRSARLGLLRYAVALRQLYAMVKPVLQQAVIPDHMAELEKTIAEIMRADAERLAALSLAYFKRSIRFPEVRASLNLGSASLGSKYRFSKTLSQSPYIS